jgi:dTDP-4-dehydrorhamnose reductase
MKILVIGASGLVGSAIYETLIDQYEVIGTYNNFKIENFKKLNLSDQIETNSFFKHNKFDVIVCCSALTNVDYCEENHDESFLNNVITVRNLLNSIQNQNTKIIYISTDYVFNGESGPYKEEDLTDPISIYGKHKLMAENLISDNSINNVVIRVTNVFGPEMRSKNFLSRLLNYKGTEELFLPIDQYATPIYSFDIGQLVNRILESNNKGLYHLGGYEYLSRQDIADLFNHYSKDKIKYKTFVTSNSFQAATRPLLGGLRNLRLKKDFPDFKFTTIQMFIEQILSFEAK